MKTFSERIEWYKEPETRRWRRIVSFFLMTLFSICGVTILVVMQIYGDGTNLQSVLSMFVSVVSISSIAMAFVFIKSNELKRWYIDIMEFGITGAIGVSVVAVLLLLRMQHVST